MFPNLFYKNNIITLIAKSDKVIARKDCRPICLVTIQAKKKKKTLKIANPTLYNMDKTL